MEIGPRAALTALVVPVLLGTLAVSIFVGAELVGATPPLAEKSPLNLAEAAAMGSMADVWRLLDAGQDPGAMYDVRPHIISSSVRHVSAWEGVIWSRRVEVVEFMDRRHPLGSLERERIACLARELRTEDIEEYLAAGGPPACASEVTAQIIARP